MWRLRDLSRFLELPGAERRRIVRAALWLLRIDLGLRTVGFARLTRALDKRRPSAREAARAEDWIRAVDVAGRHHLYPMRCLPRALALRHLLAEQGIETDLRFGVRKEGAELAAHAWLEIDGRPIGEPEQIDDRFSALLP
ncbi:MAG TPA: lasso peptide biosynthesis B2 protein [Thermoanaerobaculia bacterium]|nr:lasso peptide biosynthesis B2 protein [Thermoanaerobaculia bacterium]